MYKFIYSYMVIALLAAGCESKSSEEIVNNPVNIYITEFTFQGLGNHFVDIQEREDKGVIKVYVAAGTDIHSLTPDIVHNGSTIDPPADEAQDFSKVITYTLTDENGVTKKYDVVVAFGNATKTLSKFSSTKLGVNAVINQSKRTVSMLVPYNTDITKFSPDVQFSGYRIAPDTIAPQDFTKPVVYTVTATDGSTLNYTVELRVSDVPMLLINSSHDISDIGREFWMEGASYKLHDGKKQQQHGLVCSGKLDIKGRGNTSWGFEKKPYSLKLEDGHKTALLGMPAHRRWVLLANSADKTLLRNELTFKIGQLFDGLKWTPHAEQVELFFNDDYRGVYLLTEHLKIDNDRVDVPKISDTEPTGGYLLELLNGLAEDPWFQTSHGKVVNIKDPNDNIDAVKNSIINTVNAAENSVYAADGGDISYRQYFDVASIVDFILVNEVVKNRDVDWGSVYFYYNPAENKFFFGPLWDFDIAFGNATPGEEAYNPERFTARPCTIWLKHLFNDPDFREQVKVRWKEKSQQVHDILKYIDQATAYIDDAQQRNFERWNVMNESIWPNLPIQGSYEAEVEFVRNYFTLRLQWLDANIDNLNNSALFGPCNH
ncbi:MAG: CotH kinase family protein [Prevotellaceae bacterium]|jgi:hypothetical protein|nr:CotH kinase family protein [Prevotellaceae bacterium]